MISVNSTLKPVPPPLILYDFKTLGRVSQATLTGLIIIAVYQATALAVWYGPWWAGVMGWLEPALGKWLGRN